MKPFLIFVRSCDAQLFFLATIASWRGIDARWTPSSFNDGNPLEWTYKTHFTVDDHSYHKKTILFAEATDEGMQVGFAGF